MTKYIIGSEDDSEYESDEGTYYHAEPHERVTWEGTFSSVRQFVPKFFNPSKAIKSFAVIRPKNTSTQAGKIPPLSEALTKEHFFKALYGETKHGKNNIHLITIAENDYRLITPFFKGITYSCLECISVASEQIQLFLSAIAAVQHCHSKQIIILDLKGENIIYTLTGESFLIDGGLSLYIGDPFFLRDLTIADIINCRKKSPHVAPEYFSLSERIAATAMDIYSLGHMMKKVLKNPIPLIDDLTSRCMTFNPETRPTLDELKTTLEDMLEMTVTSSTREDLSICSC